MIYHEFDDQPEEMGFVLTAITTVASTVAGIVGKIVGGVKAKRAKQKADLQARLDAVAAAKAQREGEQQAIDESNKQLMMYGIPAVALAGFLLFKKMKGRKK
jgi:hypothetical protein